MPWRLFLLHCGMLILGDWRTEDVYWSLRQFLDEHDFAEMVNQCLWVSLADPECIARCKHD